jgi:NitT/TauT family transport system substrate-binding protein
MADQPAPQAGLTGLGKFFVALLVLGMVAAGGWLLREQLFPRGGIPFVNAPTAAPQPKGEAPGPEAKDAAGITTTKEYKYVPAEKLPPVKGVSNYRFENRTVVFPINMWIGWLPIVAANRGFRPSEESIFWKKYGFKVNLKLIDDPVAARDAYAAGESHVLWGTLDMMVLFAEELMKDSRTAPRVFQQVDWSNGGDGIVVRDTIKSVRDLKGKTVVYAQNSPSEYYVNSLLISAGIQPTAVHHKYTSSAFEAAAAFVADPAIDGCVSWAPDIYNIPDKVPRTRILSTTQDANRLITDVYAVRADFAKDHPDIVKGLVAGIFEGMAEVAKDPSPGFKYLADGFALPVEEVEKMKNDAYSTNFGENRQFFLNANNPTNFERTWKNITAVYRELGLIGSPIPFDQVMDFTVIQELDQAKAFPDQLEAPTKVFVATDFKKLSGEAPILTQTIHINFYPNSANLAEPARDEYGNVIPGKLYDPNVDVTLERVFRLSGQFTNARVAIVGHTDSSRKGQVPFEDVRRLSLARASAVRDALLKKYPGRFDANKFVVDGKGWNEPADPADPLNQAKNRRVEISIYQPEAG